MLETIEVPENDHVGSRASPQKEVGSIALMKCIYTNASSMANKAEDLEVFVQHNNCDMIAITESGGMIYTTGVLQ